MPDPTKRQPEVVLFLWPALAALVAVEALRAGAEARGGVLIRGTAYVALAYWAVAVELIVVPQRFARIVWTLACGTYLVHVAMAFEHAHHWSHDDAFRHVEAVSRFGYGIFVSYLFTLVWLADVVWWWASRTTYQRRPRWLGMSIHGFMSFVIFNATVVFADGWVRWISVAAFALLAIAYATRDWPKHIR